MQEASGSDNHGFETVTGRVLVVDDEESMRFFLERRLRRRGHFVRAVPDAESALAALEDLEWDLVLLDIKMPGRSGLDILPDILAVSPRPRVVIMTGHSTLETAVRAVGLGASEYVEKPFASDEICDAVARELFAVFREREENREDDPPPGAGAATVLGLSGPVVALRNEIDNIARTGLPVLIRGERGTEKDRVARAIHERSRRRIGPFVAVDCGVSGRTGIPVEPATLFDRAREGTLFLDEIALMPSALQVALLRVLDRHDPDGNRERVDSKPDFRVIASTTDEINAALEEGRFRKDLYYRIGVIPVRIPPLRERPGDPSWLGRRILAEIAGPDAAFAPEVYPCLEAYEWPRNVWELRNVIERAAALGGGKRIDLSALPPKIRAKRGRKPRAGFHGNGGGPFRGGPVMRA